MAWNYSNQMEMRRFLRLPRWVQYTYMSIAALLTLGVLSLRCVPTTPDLEWPLRNALEQGEPSPLDQLVIDYYMPREWSLSERMRLFGPYRFDDVIRIDSYRAGALLKPLFDGMSDEEEGQAVVTVLNKAAPESVRIGFRWRWQPRRGRNRERHEPVVTSIELPPRPAAPKQDEEDL